jgi:DNA mismatch endonuclease (patch repair protein)
MDILSPTERSKLMGLVKSKNTAPEMAVRRLTYSLGFRYRLHVRALPGCPDMVFFGRHKVIFINGCFWHKHEGCSRARLPKSRLAFWEPKLQRNRERDLESERWLAEEGWKVLVIWECEIGDKDALARRIKKFLEESENAGPAPGQRL